MEQYFTKDESIALLGQPVRYKATKFLEVEGQRYPMIEVGAPGEVFSIVNLPEGIVLGVFVDEDIEELRKDQFEHFCEVVHAVPFTSRKVS
jgi:hypothetical protein